MTVTPSVSELNSQLSAHKLVLAADGQIVRIKVPSKARVAVAEGTSAGKANAAKATKAMGRAARVTGHALANVSAASVARAVFHPKPKTKVEGFEATSDDQLVRVAVETPKRRRFHRHARPEPKKLMGF